jgi:general secretion pathway protein L
MQERETLFLFLPAVPGAATGWARAVQGRFVAHGRDWAADGFATGDARQIALAPVAVTGMAQVDLPALAPMQAAAAARLALADRLALAESPVLLSVAQGDGPRAACWVDEAWLEATHTALGEAGLVPHALIPACTLLRPAPGQILRYRVGDETLCVAQDAAWRDDPVLTAAMGAVQDAEAGAVEATLLAAADDPPCDLLAVRAQRGRGWLADAGRAIAALLLAVLIVSALIPVAHAYAQHRAADRLEAEAAQLARRAFPDAADPLAALGQGAGGGFARGYAALAQAVEAVPAAELGGLSYAPAGLQARVRLADGAARNALLRQLRSAGYEARIEAETREQGRLMLSIQVEAP